MPVQKVEIRDIVRTRQNNPCATYQQIGDKYGITRERVRQILSGYDFETGKVVSARIKRTCPLCGGTKASTSKKCSKCRAPKKVPLACDYCREIFYRDEWMVIYRFNKKGVRFQFCNKTCQGYYVAEHYGFIAHPENIRNK